MKYFKDKDGTSIRLTDERLNHILFHPEMIDMQDKIHETLNNPDYIIKSNFDERVRLYNKFYITRQFGGKYLCVVVKFDDNDAFILTSYIINKLPEGELLWQKN